MKQVIEMDKMDMIWVVTALEIYPEINSIKIISKGTIIDKVKEIWGDKIFDTMINTHLVSWKDRDCDKKQPTRGGSRKRYLFKTKDGHTPDSYGKFRLYKRKDNKYDGVDKTGPFHPEKEKIEKTFPIGNIEPETLIRWYKEEYYPSY